MGKNLKAKPNETPSTGKGEKGLKQMLTTEFKKAFEYTKGLLNTRKETLILFVLCLIPIINIFVLVRFVNKIIVEPSSNTTPPKLENPNWNELIMSLLKIIVVAIIWVVIMVVIIVSFSLIIGAGMLGGLGGMMTLIEKFTAGSIIAAIASIIVICATGIFAVMSEVHMIKKRNLNAAFNFKELLWNIQKITWPRYILFILTALIIFGIIIRITMFIDNPITLAIIGILYILPVTFLAKTISVLYDQNNPSQKKLINGEETSPNQPLAQN